MYRIAALLSAFALIGCGQKECIKPPPQVVVQTVTKYVPVPAPMTEHVATPQPKDTTVLECVRVNVARAGAIGQCNLQLDKIKALPLKAQETEQ